jgi:hypothetical protein
VKVLCEEKVSNEKVVDIKDSLVHKTLIENLYDEIRVLEEDSGDQRKVKDVPLKVNPLSKDFSYLDEEDTFGLELLDMARVGPMGTFKISKFYLNEFNKINIKIRGLKENLKNMLKGLSNDLLIEIIFDIERSFS